MKLDQGTEASPSATARGRAKRAYPTSPGFQAAFRKGWYARLAGRTVDENPYKGRTQHRGANRPGGTFTFAWRAAWITGWRAAR